MKDPESCKSGQKTIIDQDAFSEMVRRALAGYIASLDSTDKAHQLFHSSRAQALKEEIVSVGRKLWHRQYVDGNGGNISARLSSDYIICTPTMLSKGDLRPEDLLLVDLDNNRIIGDRAQTSEIRLHLEIYKAVPQARAVVHCHPPYATAHAVAGVIPQGELVPEQEVFVGLVALAPYETPGTAEFARTILPLVKQHNTILLANHGIVCWADTVTHAEWYAEIIETYCKIIMIASQLKTPLERLSPAKINELLAIKKRLGLPDARIPFEDELSGVSDTTFSSDPIQHRVSAVECLRDQHELEKLVTLLTGEVIKFVESHSQTERQTQSSRSTAVFR